jgi:hypothetical protein
LHNGEMMKKRTPDGCEEVLQLKIADRTRSIVGEWAGQFALQIPELV